MGRCLLIAVSTAAVLSISLSTSAYAQSVWHADDTKLAWQTEDTNSAALKWEIGYLALSAIDAGQTFNCLHRGSCDEGNPIFGKHPSAGKLILGKAVLGLVHFAVFNRIKDRDPKAAMRMAQISCVVQGSVVLLNARITFK